MNAKQTTAVRSVITTQAPHRTHQRMHTHTHIYRVCRVPTCDSRVLQRFTSLVSGTSTQQDPQVTEDSRWTLHSPAHNVLEVQTVAARERFRKLHFTTLVSSAFSHTPRWRHTRRGRATSSEWPANDVTQQLRQRTNGKTNREHASFENKSTELEHAACLAVYHIRVMVGALSKYTNNTNGRNNKQNK